MHPLLKKLLDPPLRSAGGDELVHWSLIFMSTSKIKKSDATSNNLFAWILLEDFL